MSHLTNIRAANRYTYYAAALVAYAQKNPAFLTTIASYIHSLPQPDGTQEVTTPYISPYALPDSDEQATTRLTWLMSHLAQKPSYETKEAIALLTAATKDITVPKNLVIGIIGFAVTFIDLGIVKKKKKKLAMRVIVRDTLRNTPVSELIQHTHEVTGTLVANELRAVFGNAQELEPDLAEWLFTDHATRLYYANAKELAETVPLLETEKLTYSTLYDEAGELLCIALSPSVSETLAVGKEAD